MALGLSTFGWSHTLSYFKHRDILHITSNSQILGILADYPILNNVANKYPFDFQLFFGGNLVHHLIIDGNLQISLGLSNSNDNLI